MLREWPKGKKRKNKKKKRPKKNLKIKVAEQRITFFSLEAYGNAVI